MKLTYLTLFPQLYDEFFNTKINKRALKNNIISKQLVNIRDYSSDKHKRVDDTPCGGGAGMVMRVDVCYEALMAHKNKDTKVILLGPRGQTFNQNLAKQLSKEKHLLFICGHYEGIDYRINQYVDLELSIGDYVLTNGDLASMVISDAIIRLKEDVINHDSIIEESFEANLLEYPQYTRPINFLGAKVPDVLLSGHHEKIKNYRLKEALRLTKQLRPDLLNNKVLTLEETMILKELEDEI